MAAFKSSRTAKNLLVSYAFESQATTRYTFFAGQAKKDGFIQVAAVFRETAEQECEHALRFFKFFNGGDLEVTARFLTGRIEATVDNLVSAADLEHFVHSDLYPGFATIARQEGFENVAKVFEAIAVAEKQHEKQYNALAANITGNTVFAKAKPVVWRCRNCGYVHTSAEAPAA